MLQGGMYVLQLMDYYSAGFCVLIIAIIECFVINWLYGKNCVYKLHCLVMFVITGNYFAV